MKKKIIGGIAILAIAAVAAFNVNLNLAQESNMSPLALANVEALAQNESGGSNGNCQKNCKINVKYACITTNGNLRGYICADN